MACREVSCTIGNFNFAISEQGIATIDDWLIGIGYVSTMLFYSWYLAAFIGAVSQ